MNLIKFIKRVGKKTVARLEYDGRTVDFDMPINYKISDLLNGGAINLLKETVEDWDAAEEDIEKFLKIYQVDDNEIDRQNYAEFFNEMKHNYARLEYLFGGREGIDKFMKGEL